MADSIKKRSIIYAFLFLSIFLFLEDISALAQSEKTGTKPTAEIEKDISKYIRNKDFGNAAKVSLELGTLYFSDANYEKAEKALKGALVYSEKVGDEEQLMSINYNLGVLYARINQYSDALDFFKTSMKLAESRGHKKVI
ncbi:MAG: tetratricopeptide repeat protein, partial [Cyclobacteriaceae bacterium]|nr:tetratricopeptide repeat protein [Cyclobacteriaceae bacterium]